MRWQDGREGNVEDRRGMGVGRVVGGGGIGLVLLAIIGVVFFDMKPEDVLNMAQQNAPSQQQGPNTNSPKPQDEAARFSNIIHTSANDVWTAIFAENGKNLSTFYACDL